VCVCDLTRTICCNFFAFIFPLRATSSWTLSKYFTSCFSFSCGASHVGSSAWALENDCNASSYSSSYFKAFQQDRKDLKLHQQKMAKLSGGLLGKWCLLFSVSCYLQVRHVQISKNFTITLPQAHLFFSTGSIFATNLLPLLNRSMYYKQQYVLWHSKTYSSSSADPGTWHSTVPWHSHNSIIAFCLSKE